MTKINAYRGDTSLNLTTEFRGWPLTTVKWYKENQELTNNGNYVMSVEECVAKLTLKTVSKHDEGTYTVVAASPCGEALLCTELCVEDVIDERNSKGKTHAIAPILLQPLTDQIIRVGKKVRFAVAASQPDVQIQWYKDKEKLHENEKYQMAHQGGVSTLDINMVEPSDEGVWRCEVITSFGYAITLAKLQAIVPKGYRKPEFLEPLKALLTEQGTVSMQCKVVGVPTPLLRWYKDGNEIKAGDMFNLHLNETDESSLGTYMCLAINCMGKAVSSAQVTVTDKLDDKYRSKLKVEEPIPHFYENLEDKTIRVGDNLRLSVRVKTPPAVQVTWYKNNEQIEASDKFHPTQIDDGIFHLDVTPIEFEDNGLWSCTATNQYGQNSLKCSIELSIPKQFRSPEFVEDLQAIFTDDGLVSFECKVIGVPTPILRWYKDGTELKPGDVHQLSGNNSLGRYSCVAKNCMGSASSFSELTLEDIYGAKERRKPPSKQPPRFIQPLKDELIILGTPLTFTIIVTCPPVPEVTWYKDNQRVDSITRYKIRRQRNGVYHLDINAAELVDQGIWKCLIVNDHGHSLTQACLRVTVPKHFKKPMFIENLRAVLSEEGAVSLQCKVVGVPQPTLTWYKDGTELKAGDIYKIVSGDGGTSCLGTYTCEAKNCMGLASSTAALLAFDDKYLGERYKDNFQQELSTIEEKDEFSTYGTPSITDNWDEYKTDMEFSIYDTPDITENEARQIIELFANEASEYVSMREAPDLPPLRFIKESAMVGNIVMEALIIDVPMEHFSCAEDMSQVNNVDNLATEADIAEISTYEPVIVDLPYDYSDAPSLHELKIDISEDVAVNNSGSGLQEAVVVEMQTPISDVAAVANPPEIETAVAMEEPASALQPVIVTAVCEDEQYVSVAQSVNVNEQQAQVTQESAGLEDPAKAVVQVSPNLQQTSLQLQKEQIQTELEPANGGGEVPTAATGENYYSDEFPPSENLGTEADIDSIASMEEFAADYVNGYADDDSDLDADEGEGEVHDLEAGEEPSGRYTPIFESAMDELNDPNQFLNIHEMEYAESRTPVPQEPLDEHLLDLAYQENGIANLLLPTEEQQEKRTSPGLLAELAGTVLQKAAEGIMTGAVLAESLVAMAANLVLLPEDQPGPSSAELISQNNVISNSQNIADAGHPSHEIQEDIIPIKPDVSEIKPITEIVQTSDSVKEIKGILELEFLEIENKEEVPIQLDHTDDANKNLSVDDINDNVKVEKELDNNLMEEDQTNNLDNKLSAIEDLSLCIAKDAITTALLNLKNEISTQENIIKSLQDEPISASSDLSSLTEDPERIKISKQSEKITEIQEEETKQVPNTTSIAAAEKMAEQIVSNFMEDVVILAAKQINNDLKEQSANLKIETEPIESLTLSADLDEKLATHEMNEVVINDIAVIQSVEAELKECSSESPKEQATTLQESQPAGVIGSGLGKMVEELVTAVLSEVVETIHQNKGETLAYTDNIAVEYAANIDIQTQQEDIAATDQAQLQSDDQLPSESSTSTINNDHSQFTTTTDETRISGHLADKEQLIESAKSLDEIKVIDASLIPQLEEINQQEQQSTDLPLLQDSGIQSSSQLEVTDINEPISLTESNNLLSEEIAIEATSLLQNEDVSQTSTNQVMSSDLESEATQSQSALYTAFSRLADELVAKCILDAFESLEEVLALLHKVNTHESTETPVDDHIVNDSGESKTDDRIKVTAIIDTDSTIAAETFTAKLLDKNGNSTENEQDENLIFKIAGKKSNDEIAVGEVNETVVLHEDGAAETNTNEVDVKNEIVVAEDNVGNIIGQTEERNVDSEVVINETTTVNDNITDIVEPVTNGKVNTITEQTAPVDTDETVKTNGDHEVSSNISNEKDQKLGEVDQLKSAEMNKDSELPLDEDNLPLDIPKSEGGKESKLRRSSRKEKRRRSSKKSDDGERSFRQDSRDSSAGDLTSDDGESLSSCSDAVHCSVRTSPKKYTRTTSGTDLGQIHETDEFGLEVDRRRSLPNIKEICPSDIAALTDFDPEMDGITTAANCGDDVSLSAESIDDSTKKNLNNSSSTDLEQFNNHDSDTLTDATVSEGHTGDSKEIAQSSDTKVIDNDNSTLIFNEQSKNTSENDLGLNVEETLVAFSKETETSPLSSEKLILIKNELDPNLTFKEIKMAEPLRATITSEEAANNECDIKDQIDHGDNTETFPKNHENIIVLPNADVNELQSESNQVTTTKEELNGNQEAGTEDISKEILQLSVESGALDQFTAGDSQQQKPTTHITEPSVITGEAQITTDISQPTIADALNTTSSALEQMTTAEQSKLIDVTQTTMDASLQITTNDSLQHQTEDAPQQPTTVDDSQQAIITSSPEPSLTLNSNTHVSSALTEASQQPTSIDDAIHPVLMDAPIQQTSMDTPQQPILTDAAEQLTNTDIQEHSTTTGIVEHPVTDTRSTNDPNLPSTPDVPEPSIVADASKLNMTGDVSESLLTADSPTQPSLVDSAKQLTSYAPEQPALVDVSVQPAPENVPEQHASVDAPEQLSIDISITSDVLQTPVVTDAQNMTVDTPNQLPSMDNTEQPTPLDTPEQSTLTDVPEQSIITVVPEPTLITDAPQPSIIADAPEPSIIAVVPEPILITDAPQPSIIADAPEPTLIANAPEPSIITDAQESSILADAPESSIIADASEPSLITDATEPSLITDATEPSIIANATEPSLITDAQESSILVDAAETPITVAGPEPSIIADVLESLTSADAPNQPPSITTLEQPPSMDVSEQSPTADASMQPTTTNVQQQLLVADVQEQPVSDFLEQSTTNSLDSSTTNVSNQCITSKDNQTVEELELDKVVASEEDKEQSQQIILSQSEIIPASDDFNSSNIASIQEEKLLDTNATIASSDNKEENEYVIHKELQEHETLLTNAENISNATEATPASETIDIKEDNHLKVDELNGQSAHHIKVGVGIETICLEEGFETLAEIVNQSIDNPTASEAIVENSNVKIAAIVQNDCTTENMSSFVINIPHEPIESFESTLNTQANELLHFSEILQMIPTVNKDEKIEVMNDPNGFTTELHQNESNELNYHPDNNNDEAKKESVAATEEKFEPAENITEKINNDKASEKTTAETVNLHEIDASIDQNNVLNVNQDESQPIKTSHTESAINVDIESYPDNQKKTSDTQHDDSLTTGNEKITENVAQIIEQAPESQLTKTEESNHEFTENNIDSSNDQEKVEQTINTQETIADKLNQVESVNQKEISQPTIDTNANENMDMLTTAKDEVFSAKPAAKSLEHDAQEHEKTSTTNATSVPCEKNEEKSNSSDNTLLIAPEMKSIEEQSNVTVIMETSEGDDGVQLIQSSEMTVATEQQSKQWVDAVSKEKQKIEEEKQITQVDSELKIKTGETCNKEINNETDGGNIESEVNKSAGQNGEIKAESSTTESSRQLDANSEAASENVQASDIKSNENESKLNEKEQPTENIEKIESSAKEEANKQSENKKETAEGAPKSKPKKVVKKKKSKSIDKTEEQTAASVDVDKEKQSTKSPQLDEPQTKPEDSTSSSANTVNEVEQIAENKFIISDELVEEEKPKSDATDDEKVKDALQRDPLEAIKRKFSQLSIEEIHSGDLVSDDSSCQAAMVTEPTVEIPDGNGGAKPKTRNALNIEEVLTDDVTLESYTKSVRRISRLRTINEVHEISDETEEENIVISALTPSWVEAESDQLNESHSTDQSSLPSHCVTKHRIERSSKSSNSKDKHTPQFIMKLKDITIPANYRMRLTCCVIGTPEPLVKWLKNGVLVDSAMGYREINDLGICVLEIPRSSSNDTAEYTCIASNEHGETSTTGTLTVKDKPIKQVEIDPTPPRPVIDAKGKCGDSITMDCSVTGWPAPSVTWLKDEEVIKPSDRVSTSDYVSGAHRLSIDNVTLEDSGVYKCVASNHLGKDEVMAAVKVSGKRAAEYSKKVSRPLFFTKPHNRVVREGESVKFTCSVIGHPPPRTQWEKDGSSLTTSSRLQLIDKDDVHSLIINDISPNDAGIYKVTALNSAGKTLTTVKLDVVAKSRAAISTVRDYNTYVSSSSSYLRPTAATRCYQITGFNVPQVLYPSSSYSSSSSSSSSTDPNRFRYNPRYKY
ncbi:hypothetical protein CHUAL_002405 [Chamberlinius hualienensis]